MRLLITLLFLSLTLVCSSQTAGNRNLWFKRTTVTPPAPGNQPFSFTAIPFSDDDQINPGRGAEQWHNGSAGISYPSTTSNLPSKDLYYRFQWYQVEGATQDSYTWTYFDGLALSAINANQQFSFGIMTVFTGGGITYDGGNASYPLYLHNLMQAEAVNSRDWLTGDGDWIPNFNSPNYLARLRALHVAINNHINTTSIVATAGPKIGQSIPLSSIIYCIDVRGYGNYGEWHTGGICDWGTFPAGRQPTAASLKEIIDTHTEVFTNPAWYLVMMIAAYDGGGTFIPLFVPIPEVAYYAATATTPSGDTVGWRRDQWGATDGYLNTLLAGNTVTYNGSQQLRYYILNRWKSSTITGEPPGWVDNSYIDLPNQVNTYHATSFGNGNYNQNLDLTTANNVRAAFKLCGYRLIITTGTAPQVITRGVSFNIEANWQNTGIAPAYNNWTVQYELQNTVTSAVVWTGTSSKVLRKFRNDQGIVETTDLLTVPVDVVAGTYKLVVRVKDPLGYRPDMRLMVTGRNADGTFTIFPNVVVN